MFISQKCFKEATIINYIRRFNTLGICDFSGQDNTYIMDMENLYLSLKDEILSIFDLYEYKNNHLYITDYLKLKNIEIKCKQRENMDIPYNSLLNLLQDNWNFFDLEIISIEKANEVLLFWANKYRPYIQYDSEALYDPFWYDARYLYWGYFVKEDWEFLKENMMHNFRFNLNYIPKINFDVDELLSYEIFNKISWRYKKGRILYRARIKNKNVDKYTRSEMLIPPNNIKSAGRANPLGINYLYTADKVETTIAEVRAWKNCTVSIAKLELKKDLILIDLSILDIPDSLFQKYPYEDLSIMKRVQYWELEELLYETLSNPVDPRESDIEYVFTQFICEKIKGLGYDGISFKSSLSDGLNVVLFSDSYVRLKSIDDYTVKDIMYMY